MTMLQQILPEQRTIGLDEVTLQIRQAFRTPIGVKSAEARKFCGALSALLLNDAEARKFPALQALGFWLRPAAVDAMVADYLADGKGFRRMPNGVVFAIPPANTENLFGYIAAMSLLSGNVTVMRLPSAAEPAQELLSRLMGEAIGALPTLRSRLILLRYGHNAAVTTALSSFCDARLVWGGDETVQTIRATAPLPPLAREASFADRFSVCAMNAARFMALSEPERDNVAQSLYTDIYTFDQLACASPRLLVWVGVDSGAAADFYARLAAVAIRKQYQPDAGESLAKRSAAYLALHDLDVATFEQFGLALSVVTLNRLEKFTAFKSVTYGYGLLVAARLPALADLAKLAERRDQTLVLWGFADDAAQDFVSNCHGRGFDRIVKPGEALAFDPVWDGLNLFDVMTRLVRVGV